MTRVWLLLSGSTCPEAAEACGTPPMPNPPAYAMEGAPAYVDGTNMEDTLAGECVSMETTGIVAIVGIIEVPGKLNDCMVLVALLLVGAGTEKR